MKLNEKLVWNHIRDIKPLVEEKVEKSLELSKLKVSIDNPKASSIMEYFDNIINYGEYGINPEHEFSFPKNYKLNEDGLKWAISHELTHFFQGTYFPKKMLLLQELINNKEKEKEFGKKFWALYSLIEGDAVITSSKIREEREWYTDIDKIYYLPQIWISEIIMTIATNKFLPYYNGEKILRQKFNDGKDRKSINELYTAPLEELVKIFEKD